MDKFTYKQKYTVAGIAQDPTINAVFTNGSFIVERHYTDDEGPYAFRLAVKRKDKEPIRSWRELQDIKNAIAGVDAVAIEIYPRESEVTDTANIYHLWVMHDAVDLCASIVPPQE